jgi:biopolymer transport protein ExbB/TolQ
MDFNINTLIALGALVVSVLIVLSRAFDKNLTLREHEEYKKGIMDRLERDRIHIEERLVIREFEAWVTSFRRDVDRIEEIARTLDRTKPTTGELQAATKALEDRIISMEERLRTYNVREINVDKTGRERHGQ